MKLVVLIIPFHYLDDFYEYRYLYQLDTKISVLEHAFFRIIHSCDKACELSSDISAWKGRCFEQKINWL
jgi:hypothetical protein